MIFVVSGEHNGCIVGVKVGIARKLFMATPRLADPLGYLGETCESGLCCKI